MKWYVACIKHAQEQGLPLFADYLHPSVGTEKPQATTQG